MDREATRCRPALARSNQVPAPSGNPFDVEAFVRFSHDTSGEPIRTRIYDDGVDCRTSPFTAIRTGVCNHRTFSEYDRRHTGTSTMAIAIGRY